MSVIKLKHFQMKNEQSNLNILFIEESLFIHMISFLLLSKVHHKIDLILQ